MLCHSLETLRESRILWHFIEPSFAFGASLSHFLPHCSLFFHSFWRVCARLQARGLARGTAISRIPWSCRNFSLWKIMESPWQEGITRLRVDKVNKTSCFFANQNSDIWFWISDLIPIPYPLKTRLVYTIQNLETSGFQIPSVLSKKFHQNLPNFERVWTCWWQSLIELTPAVWYNALGMIWYKILCF